MAARGDAAQRQGWRGSACRCWQHWHQQAGLQNNNTFATGYTAVIWAAGTLTAAATLDRTQPNARRSATLMTSQRDGSGYEPKDAGNRWRGVLRVCCCDNRAKPRQNRLNSGRKHLKRHPLDTPPQTGKERQKTCGVVIWAGSKKARSAAPSLTKHQNNRCTITLVKWATLSACCATPGL